MKILNWFMTALLVIGTAVVTYWASDRRSPVTIIEEVVDTPQVVQDGALRVRYTVHREKICHVHLEQYLFDSRRGRFSIPDDDHAVSPGPVGPEEFAIVVDIPRQFLPGKARYRAIRSYTCNPIHKWFDWPVVVVAPDVEFTVVQDKEVIYDLPDNQRLGDQIRRGTSGATGLSGQGRGVQGSDQGGRRPDGETQRED